MLLKLALIIFLVMPVIPIVLGLSFLFSHLMADAGVTNSFPYLHEARKLLIIGFVWLGISLTIIGYRLFLK